VTGRAPQASTLKPGDWVEVDGLPGRASRRGQVIETLGRPGHEHYRIRWDEKHESLHFPADGGLRLIHPKRTS